MSNLAEEPVLNPEEFSNSLNEMNDDFDDNFDIEFDIPDKTESRKDIDTSKYTLIDNLDEDDSIPNQNYVLISFISPEGVMNCNIRGVKIRGFASSEKQARKMADEIKKKDKYFDIFIGEVGKWLPWNPDPLTVKDAEYRDKRETNIMKEIHKNNNDKLNELVGRYKDNLTNSKKQHKKRIVNTVKENLNDVDNEEEQIYEETLNDNKEKQDITEQMRTSNPKKIRPTRNKNRNGTELRERMRKIYEAKKQKEEKQKTENNELEQKKLELENEKDRLSKESKNLQKLAIQSD
jgi:hypothetical protein